VLDEDHYDLEKVKERILEYLAVRKLNKRMKGRFYVLSPARRGQTSLGQSIARPWGASSPAFHWRGAGRGRDSRASPHLHRRVARRILQGLKTAGTNNRSS
jgi:ATP-dependent Lon protease